MAEYNLGKVIPQFKGRYDKKETYEDLDVVAHENKTFISLVNGNKENALRGIHQMAIAL